jgi:hypothetical protein
MRVLIRKYELKMISIKVHLFHDRDNLLLYTRKHVHVHVTVCFYQNVLSEDKLYAFILQNVIFYLNLQVLEVHTLSMYRLHQTEC